MLLTEQQSNEGYKGSSQPLWNAASPGTALKQVGVEFVERTSRGLAPVGPHDGATAGEEPAGDAQPGRTADRRARSGRTPPGQRRQDPRHRGHSGGRPKDDPPFAGSSSTRCRDSGFSDAISDTVRRRGLERPKGEAPGITLGRHTEQLDASRLRSLMLELEFALARGACFALSSSYPEDLTTTAATYEIDIFAIAPRPPLATSVPGAPSARRGRKGRPRPRRPRLRSREPRSGEVAPAPSLSPQPGQDGFTAS